MNGVALRCPHCGTTQSGSGECGACHEATVQYFCANHSPGRWLDGPSCTLCGARFGEARPAPRVPPTRPSAPPPSRGAPPAAGPRTAPPPIRTAPPPRSEASFDPRTARPAPPTRSPWLRRGPSPSEPRPRDADISGEDAEAIRRRWTDVVRSRMRPGFDAEAREPRSTLPGCSRAALLGVIFIVILIAMAPFSAGPILQLLLQILLSH